jgi:precorrin-3B synthase
LGGALSIEQATCIAQASKRFGNGVIELTNRANIQLRGIAPENEAALTATLVQAGLGAGSDQADEASNLLLSPLAGFCPDALFDVRTLAQALVASLRQASGTPMSTGISGSHTDGEQAVIAGLSPKFSVQLDGGESLAMLGHHHDIWFSALPCDDTAAMPSALLKEGHWFAFGIAGSPPTSARQSEVLGAVFSSLIPGLAIALVTTFLTLRTHQDSRMRDIVNRLGAAAVWQHAARLIAALPATDVPGEHKTRGVQGGVEKWEGWLVPPHAALSAWRRAPVDAGVRFGAHEQRAEVSAFSASPSASCRISLPVSRLQYVGGQAPLGRLRADNFLQLAHLAQTYQQGKRGLRITPWQGVLLPDIATPDVRQVQSLLREAGLIDSPLQPLGALVACTGNSGCAKGHANSKADAYALAERLDRPLAVHLSACERSCAAAHPMPFTLLAQPSGTYDLYRADQRPNPRFGKRIAAGLTIDQAAAYLNTLPNAALDVASQASAPSSSPSTTCSLHPLPTLSSTDTSQKSHA